MIGESFIADEPSIFGKVDKAYIAKEIELYMTKEPNINWMQKPIPEIWKSVANKNGEVNSNYGLLVFSFKNFHQYLNVLNTLKKDESSRRAIMIYTRPTMHTDFDFREMNDFICTNSVQYLIRNNQLDVIVNMRSNDAIFGYKNDYAWQRYVQLKLCIDLKETYSNLKVGTIYWQTGSIHIYERHFKYLEGVEIKK